MIKRGVRLIPFSWWAGRLYRETLSQGLWFDQASRKDLRHYQEQKLGEILRFAVEQVPAYRSFQTIVERHRPFDALKEFPLLDKDTLQKNFQEYLPCEFEKIPHYEISTGGTSGNQLTFFVDADSQNVENAFQHRLWRRVGYSIRKRRVTFRGVAFPNLRPNIYWQHNPIYNEIQFSPFHMNDKTLGAYVDEIARFHPEYIYGYPSAIDFLGEFVLREGLQRHLPSFRAALLLAEGVTDAQRQRIEAAFSCRVFSFYGHSERVVMGGECEENSTYHHFPDYGVLELIADGGAVCDKEGQRGELIGTGFLNRSLPLIRYRTGDFATRCEFQCKCGRCWDRFTDVEGHRKQDMLVGHMGARFSLAAINMHGPLFRNVIRFQYFQEQPGAFELRIMVAPGFSNSDRRTILRAYNNKIGAELDFKVRVVDDIPLTSRGKLRLLDSRLKGANANTTV